MFEDYILLLGALFQGAITAEHLAVLRDGFSAFAPRGDVVGVHFFKLELLAAVNAFVPLFLVGGHGIATVERPDRQFFLHAGQ